MFSYIQLELGTIFCLIACFVFGRGNNNYNLVIEGKKNLAQIVKRRGNPEVTNDNVRVITVINSIHQIIMTYIFSLDWSSTQLQMQAGSACAHVAKALSPA